MLDNRKKLRKQVQTYMAHTTWKKVRIRSFSGPHFPAFGLNMERYSISLRIHFKCGKILIWETANTDTLHAVSHDTVTKGSPRVNNGWRQPGTNIWNTNEPLYCPSICTTGYDPFLNSWIYLWAGKPYLLQYLFHKTNCHPLDNLYIVH